MCSKEKLSFKFFRLFPSLHLKSWFVRHLSCNVIWDYLFPWTSIIKWFSVWSWMRRLSEGEHVLQKCKVVQICVWWIDKLQAALRKRALLMCTSCRQTQTSTDMSGDCLKKICIRHLGKGLCSWYACYSIKAWPLNMAAMPLYLKHESCCTTKKMTGSLVSALFCKNHDHP